MYVYSLNFCELNLSENGLDMKSIEIRPHKVSLNVQYTFKNTV